MNDILNIKHFRIGNYLYYDGFVVHISFLSIDADDEYQDLIGFCELDKDHDEISDWVRSYRIYGRLVPIPITNQVLISVGFENLMDEESPEYYLNGYRYINGYLYFRTSSIEISYLHQLQNLYFLLEGVELKYEQ